ncbi:MAG: phage portal protein [Clostridiales bacterium]|nr:phage portal protein [Clostridiales bacterium]
MLFNLDFLNRNQPFPPTQERERLTRYAQNKKIFDNNHQDVYSEQLRRIEKVVGNVSTIISYPIVLNFQKKMSLKTADLLFLERPIVKANKDNKQKAVDAIVANSDLFGIGYEGAIDCSRYGSAVFKVDVEDGKGKIAISSPEYLYIIVDPDDRKKIAHYVLAWTHKDTLKGRDITCLRATVHSKGSYRAMKYELDNVGGYGSYTIRAMLEDSGEMETGLTDFAVIPIHNLLTSDSVYGIDDYMDVDSIVSELEVRTAQVSKILDVFASPTVSGTTAALEPDGSGGYAFNAGNFYARNNVDEPPLEYITWNANLEANFKQIEKLLNYLCVISEMGAAIFDTELKTGTVPSGAALQKLYINVLAKVARVRNQFDAGFKRAIATASQIGHTKVAAEDISIIWQDGLPNDPKEEADILAVRTGGRATMSIKRGLMEYDGLSGEMADAEVGEIANEEIADMPVSLSTEFED